MDKLRALTEYYRAFRAEATQLNSRPIARQWMEADVPAEEAAAWANLGYLPEEALPRRAAGLTPEQAADQDAALIAEHGIIGATAMMLQLETPGATLIVDPDAEAAIEKIEDQQ